MHTLTATLKLFRENRLNKVLISGFGYGRNAKIFTDAGLLVTGIEISETAIDIAKKHYGNDIHVYHGSVGAMPFGQEIYDGIFCYALLHLLDEKERIKLINDCYNQLKPDGYMVFVAISKNDSTYGDGKELGKDRFETKHGIQLFFYDSDSVEKEFGKYGIIEFKEIDEPAKNRENKPSQRFWQIICRKQEK